MSERPPKEDLPSARRPSRFTPKRIVITALSLVVVLGGGGYTAYRAVQNSSEPPPQPMSLTDLGKLASGDLYAPDPEADLLKAEAEQAYRADQMKKDRKGAAGKGLDWVVPKKAPGGDGFPAMNFPPGSDPSPGSNKATAKAMLASFGFGADQWGCLESLWQKESGWNERAMNRYSGAYGIPQSLPGTKMASAGADWQTNAATQIKWGLGYIKGRYGTPCAAWGHSQRVGWY
ncbi:aggregation-promoting factor C-terminal-like domain-containing protein [Nonomuraea gerenzanensis]|uniref:Secreted protein n=1 Tax=Nonomuraea gerenzanensis TaxID=93944 RepID=A0A1M4EQL4_9ACTN|nr:lytic transglycosylase domain-containing protein [Nonomuraea gerenzanensis]UBU12349.1 lytic transglycosylase domain-containing protein [Nonomuraea gerenzanensis]SBP00893.1 secreted protein [Nonomuraea gerenzanensis]